MKSQSDARIWEIYKQSSEEESSKLVAGERGERDKRKNQRLTLSFRTIESNIETRNEMKKTRNHNS